MKNLILLVAMFVSVNAFASADAYYTECKKLESDKACVQRIVKESDVMNANFYTGKESERPMIYNAIFNNAKSVTLLRVTGEGGSTFSEYLLVYDVAATELSGLKAATFVATLEKSLEDGKKIKVVGRSVLSSNIKVLTGASEE